MERFTRLLEASRIAYTLTPVVIACRGYSVTPPSWFDFEMGGKTVSIRVQDGHISFLAGRFLLGEVKIKKRWRGWRTEFPEFLRAAFDRAWTEGIAVAKQAAFQAHYDKFRAPGVAVEAVEVTGVAKLRLSISVASPERVAAVLTLLRDAGFIPPAPPPGAAS